MGESGRDGLIFGRRLRSMARGNTFELASVTGKYIGVILFGPGRIVVGRSRVFWVRGGRALFSRARGRARFDEATSCSLHHGC